MLQRVSTVLTMVVAIVVMSAMSGLAQEQAFSAAIVSGDCESDTVVAELTGLDLPTGPQVGAQNGRTAASSFTAVPVSFDQLTASEHAIQAADSCGPIGGAVNSAGALIVVLAGDDDESGIAYLSPNAANPTQTDVSVFLAPATDARDIAEPTGDGGTADAQAAVQADLAARAASGGAGLTPAAAIEAEAEAVADAEIPTLVPAVTSEELSGDELAYTTALSDNITAMGASVGRNGDLFLNARLEDPSWYDEVAVELAIQDELYRQFNLLVSPPAFVEVHQLVFEAYTLVILAGDDLELGLSTFDATAIEAGTAKFLESGALMEQATVLIEEIIAQRGG